MLQLKKYVFIFLFGISFFIACSGDEEGGDAVSKNELELIFSERINVKEPSGLAINKSGSVLYTVSDNTAQVYMLSTNGNVIQTLNYKGNDLEGISAYKGNNLLLAEERTKEIVEFDMSTGVNTKHRIDFNNNNENSGIEGVAYAENINSIFILNEKDPGKLLRLRSDFSVSVEYDLNFASDYSGIFYDDVSKELWIVSDQSKTINKCTLKGDIIESYSIRVTQAEGIAMANDKIYVVSDAEEKLYIFKKPQN